MLDRALAECERVLTRATPLRADDLARLRGLVRFARGTRMLGTASPCGLHDEQQALERLSGELDRARAEIGDLERRLGGTLKALDAPPDRTQLAELFAELARLCHKINNPLTAVMGRAQMLQLKLGQAGDESTGKTAKVIEESAQRVAAYVQELALVCNRGKAEFTGS
jgi:signal transduction histidine kinase